MNFSTRDLLLATTLLAIYGYAFSIAIDLTALSSSFLFFGSVFVATILGNACAMEVGVRRKAGTCHAYSKAPYFWWLHIALASGFLLLMSLPHLSETKFRSSPLVFVSFLIPHALLFCLPRVMICENGVVVASKFMKWSEYEFWVDENYLHWKKTEALSKFSFSLNTGKAYLQEQALVSFHKALAEKQNTIA